MSDVNDKAKFAAREFIARWCRESEEHPSSILTDRMSFAFEMGYLRGRTDGTRVAMTLFDETYKKVTDVATDLLEIYKKVMIDG